ncbi:uncharacterized protein LOC118742348 isoform X2 [Rhagoletis pomonella]|uniref:uncharacterized protein LOC118742348 isoform X2 n=1 Tax=Rhagoletis pomonella TaxID=28610 RepID=UPI001782B6CB|nr:uncharacterized protein LOC118742348 isoform X2 [Rhagoletis pomonella]
MQPCWSLFLYHIAVSFYFLVIRFVKCIINGDCKNYCNPCGFPLGKCVLVVTKGGVPNRPGIRLLLQNKMPQPLLW